jgi:hypothetical protein
MPFNDSNNGANGELFLSRFGVFMRKIRHQTPPFHPPTPSLIKVLGKVATGSELSLCSRPSPSGWMLVCRVLAFSEAKTALKHGKINLLINIREAFTQTSSLSSASSSSSSSTNSKIIARRVYNFEMHDLVMFGRCVGGRRRGKRRAQMWVKLKIIV